MRKRRRTSVLVGLDLDGYPRGVRIFQGRRGRRQGIIAAAGVVQSLHVRFRGARGEYIIRANILMVDQCAIAVSADDADEVIAPDEFRQVRSGDVGALLPLHPFEFVAFEGLLDHQSVGNWCVLVRAGSEGGVECILQMFSAIPGHAKLTDGTVRAGHELAEALAVSASTGP